MDKYFIVFSKFDTGDILMVKKHQYFIALQDRWLDGLTAMGWAGIWGDITMDTNLIRQII